MGYTNYWEQSTDFTTDEWCAVMNEAEYLKGIGKNFNVGIYKDEIIINGNLLAMKSKLILFIRI